MSNPEQINTTSHEDKVNAHFLRLARRGFLPGCSSGERAARNLAEAAFDFAPRLDSQAAEGLHAWIELCRRLPSEAQDFLESCT